MHSYAAIMRLWWAQINSEDVLIFLWVNHNKPLASSGTKHLWHERLEQVPPNLGRGNFSFTLPHSAVMRTVTRPASSSPATWIPTWFYRNNCSKPYAARNYMREDITFSDWNCWQQLSSPVADSKYKTFSQYLQLLLHPLHAKNRPAADSGATFPKWLRDVHLQERSYANWS